MHVELGIDTGMINIRREKVARGAADVTSRAPRALYFRSSYVDFIIKLTYNTRDTRFYYVVKV